MQFLNPVLFCTFSIYRIANNFDGNNFNMSTTLWLGLGLGPISLLTSDPSDQ